MPKVVLPADSTAQTKTLESLTRWVSQNLEALLDGVNGRLSLVDNVQGQLATVTFSSGQVQVPHNLRRMPRGYIVVKRSVDLTVFDGSQSNTSKDLYVQASAAGQATLFIF